MFDVKIERLASHPKLLRGLAVIAKAAASVYGSGRILCVNATGGSVYSEKMKVILTDGRFEDPDAEYARQLLIRQELPEDGLKTAVLLTNECLQTAQVSRLDKQDFLDGMDSLLKTASEKLQEIAKANGKILPGGGLYLLNLCRPVMRELESAGAHPVCRKFVYALEKPFLLLAENAGREPHEAFSRVQAVAPTQFYSLKHFGLEGGHIPLSEHRDLWRIGIDLRNGKIVDLMAADVTIPLEIALATLETVRAFASCVCSVHCVL
jgi:chaperonin GroEL (HSP60 family)